MNHFEDPQRHTALIHLQVPAELKARWVRASRAVGMRLSDWIVQQVERAPHEESSTIPIGLSDGKDWARFFWWDGEPERFRAGLRAICDDLDGARAPWQSLVWVILTPKGCMSATNSVYAQPVGAVRADDDSAISDFWVRVVGAHRHDKAIRTMIRQSIDLAVGPHGDPLEDAIGHLRRAPWMNDKTDIAILRVGDETGRE